MSITPQKFCAALLIIVSCALLINAKHKNTHMPKELPEIFQQRWVDTKTGDFAYNIHPKGIIWDEDIRTKTREKIEYKIIKKLSNKDFVLIINQHLSKSNNYYYIRLTIFSDKYFENSKKLCVSAHTPFISQNEWHNDTASQHWQRIKDNITPNFWESYADQTFFWNDKFWQSLFVPIFDQSLKK